jgi:hypothetical protein
MTVRAQRAELAAALRAEGLLQREIAERLGLSRTYVHALLSDPDGSKAAARKAGYRGTCLNCGRRTDGSNGRALAPVYCARCHPSCVQTKWTRDTILAAFRLFAETMGRPPAASDSMLAARGGRGNPSLNSHYSRARRAESVRAYKLGLRLPHPGIVTRLWTEEGWRGALAEAGLSTSQCRGGQPTHRAAA